MDVGYTILNLTLDICRSGFSHSTPAGRAAAEAGTGRSAASCELLVPDPWLSRRWFKRCRLPQPPFLLRASLFRQFKCLFIVLFFSGLLLSLLLDTVDSHPCNVSVAVRSTRLEGKVSTLYCNIT